ncbi:MAG: acyl carrier protein, partial [Betaproteobacteria bacterium]|nr:acyl carrier protein [Betaproteobacteria bacterium]
VSFLESGTIDSTGVLEVILFMEERFGIKVEDRDLTPANIDSVDNQVRFVMAKLAQQSGNAA